MIDQTDATNVVSPPHAGKIYRVSWVGYLKPMTPYVMVLIVLCALFWFAPRLQGNWPYYLAGVLAVPWAIGMVYRFASIRVVKLFTNDAGVWLSRGVFPWQKAISGVRWEEAGEAIAITGVVAWATGAYNVGVMHRYTKKTELWHPRIAHGSRFVGQVNAIVNEHHGRSVNLQ